MDAVTYCAHDFAIINQLELDKVRLSFNNGCRAAIGCPSARRGEETLHGITRKKGSCESRVMDDCYMPVSLLW